jgi:Pyridoxamine 5'-phosphate oxidase
MLLTEPMRQMVADQQLGFVATTRPDGAPAVSPKGTLRVWSDTRSSEGVARFWNPTGPSKAHL